MTAPASDIVVPSTSATIPASSSRAEPVAEQPVVADLPIGSNAKFETYTAEYVGNGS